MPEAYQEFQKAVDVTPYMARQLIEELKQMNVQYVVCRSNPRDLLSWRRR
jgi:exonuclease-1